MHTNARIHRIAAGVCLASLLTACQAPAPRETAPPDLQLIGTAPLNLPEACSASGSVIVDFTVRPDGLTENIQPAAGPACVQEALTAWVASFRYSPPGRSTNTSVEWLLVEAKKGS
jgi:hypothetical protein